METLQILHLEDSQLDAQLIQLELQESGLLPAIQICTNKTQFLNAMSSGNFDLILSDNGLIDLTGKEAFNLAKKTYPNIPFIFISGRGKKEDVITYLNTGATDYISKEQLWKLPSIIKKFGSEKKDRIKETKSDLYIKGMEMLITVVQKLSLARTLEQIAEIVRKAARELTGADGATFVLKDNGMCYYMDEDAIAPLWKGKRFPLEICIGGWAMMNRQPAVVNDVYQDDRIPIAAYRPTFVKSLVTVPIRKADPIGSIGNYWANYHEPTTEEVMLLQALADTTSVAMENVQIYSELEQRVSDRTAELAGANRDLEAFAYTISHDLRNPLTIINGFAGLLRGHKNEQFDHTTKEYVNSICDAGDKMNAQIDHVLNFYRSTTAELACKEIHLSMIVEDVLTNIQGADTSREVEILIEPDIMVIGDEVLLRGVMENILSNAWKYSSKKEQAKIEFGQLKLEDKKVLYVRDNGAGFDMNKAGKLFTPFQRMHSDLEFSGTGLGLSSVQKIINKHGGKIWFESQIDQGTTFYFTLEVARVGG